MDLYLFVFRDRDQFVNGTSGRRTRKNSIVRSAIATVARDHRNVRTAAKETRRETTDTAAPATLQVLNLVFFKRRFYWHLFSQFSSQDWKDRRWIPACPFVGWFVQKDKSNALHLLVASYRWTSKFATKLIRINFLFANWYFRSSRRKNSARKTARSGSVAWRKIASKEKNGSKKETLVVPTREETVAATKVGIDAVDLFPVIVDIIDVELRKLRKLFPIVFIL